MLLLLLLLLPLLLLLILLVLLLPLILLLLPQLLLLLLLLLLHRVHTCNHTRLWFFVVLLPDAPDVPFITSQMASWLMAKADQSKQFKSVKLSLHHLDSIKNKKTPKNIASRAGCIRVLHPSQGHKNEN